MNQQPYQQASDQIIKQTEAPKRLIKTAGTIAGSALIARALPLLSPFVPLNLMTKGLSKIDPRLGKFFTAAEKAGFGLEEAREFMKEKIQPQEKGAQDNRNIIQKYSDQLHEFLKNHIQQGRDPLEAGALAQLDPKFKNIISKIEKDNKAPFSAILQSSYGSSQQSQQPQQQAQPQQSQQPPQGNNDQDILAALQKILQM